jgi:hypothetical protein
MCLYDNSTVTYEQNKSTGRRKQQVRRRGKKVRRSRKRPKFVLLKIEVEPQEMKKD